jgi:WD40 repeat protein
MNSHIGNGKPLVLAILVLALGFPVLAQEPLATFKAQTAIFQVVFAPDGKTLAARGPAGKINLLDVAIGKELRSFQGRKPYLSPLAFSSTGKKLAAGTGTGELTEYTFLEFPFLFQRKSTPSEREVIIWDVSSGKEKTVIPIQQGFSAALLRFGRDAKTLIITDNTGGLKTFDAESGKEVQSEKGMLSAADCMAWAPRESLLAFGNDYGGLTVLDRSNKKKWTARHRPSLTALAFSPDSAKVASGGTDVRLWDVASGKQEKTFKTFPGAVFSLAFSPDGKMLAAGGGRWGKNEPGRICLWDWATGKQVATFQAHRDQVNTVAFSPDGTLLATGSQDKTVCLWRVPRVADAGK